MRSPPPAATKDLDHGLRGLTRMGKQVADSHRFLLLSTFYSSTLSAKPPARQSATDFFRRVSHFIAKPS